MNRQRFRLIPVAAGLAAIAVIAAPATPAVASPPSVTCQGPTCALALYNQIVISGDKGGSVSPTPIAVQPPLCWYIPNAPQTSPVAMAEFQFGQDPIGVWDGNLGDPAAAHLNSEILTDANASIDRTTNLPFGTLKFNGPPKAGIWYDLAGYSTFNSSVSHCMSLAPLDQFFVFVPPGTQPPVPPVPVPGLTIAQFVANHQTVPVPRVRLSPPNKGFVNLATYLWATWARSVVSRTMAKYVTFGTLGQEQVTVTSVPVKFVINLTGPGTTYTSCTLTPHGNYTGSAAPFGKPPASTPGTPPDCGVLFSAPSKGSSISVTITWQRSWTGVNVPDGPGGPLPPATQTSGVTTVPVNEIQSINGG